MLGGGAGDNSVLEPEEERGPPHQPCPGPALLVLGPVGQSLYCPHTGGPDTRVSKPPVWHFSQEL